MIHSSIVTTFPVKLCILLILASFVVPWDARQSLRLLPKPGHKQVLAFYFPQFHEFEENNKFWGKGFTDFTNVAKVQYAAHGHPIIRPSERNGFYDILDPFQRKFQGELALKYGISGFVFMHYWFSAKPIMSGPLEGLLNDGFPNIQFCLMWANEHWSRKWDGLNGSDVLLTQTYSPSSWDKHWDWLVRFFRHKNYILVEKKPMLVLYRASDIPELHALLKKWRAYAIRDGFAGLHVIQMNGVEWTKGALEPQPDIDGVIEYYPNLYNGPQWPVNKIVSTKATGPNHYFGARCGWDNTPRHITDGRYSHQLMHPSVYSYVLKQNLARTSSKGFVFVNAWNEWGEGASIEPSLEWGRRWLEVTRQAVADLNAGHVSSLGSDGYASSVPLRDVGIPREGHGKVCIVVRTFFEHATGFYNLRQHFSSLQALRYKNWMAFVSTVDNNPFPGLKGLLQATADPRFVYAQLPSIHLEEFKYARAGYLGTDVLLNKHCYVDTFRWILVTNGDNWYTPDALNYLPVSYDLVLLNFFGRYAPINEVLMTNATQGDYFSKNCCVRFNNLQCTTAAPKVGFVDLGGLLMNAVKAREMNFNFTKYDNVCTSSCHDGAAAAHLVSLGWTYYTHPVGSCAFLHNPNPVSCALVGGTYWDTLDFSKAGCYDFDALPMSHYDINYYNFIRSKKSCIC